MTVLVAIAMLIASLYAVLRVWIPWRPRLEGSVLRQFRMPLRARLVRQIVPLVALALIAIVNVLIGSLAWWIPLVPLALLAASVLVPARYTVTERGIGVGALTFRRWTEFSGVYVRRGRIHCKSIYGVQPLVIWLPGGFHDADAVALIRRLIRGAYKGNLPVESSAADDRPLTEPDASLNLV